MNPKKIFLLLVLVLFWAVHTNAGVIHVPGDYPSIRQALEHAYSGDTVLVAPGTYDEVWSVVLNRTGVTLLSERGPDSTIIDMQCRDWPVIEVQSSASDTTAVISGFTIKRGCPTTNLGGGIYCVGSPIIQNCIITDNHAWRGGGIWVAGQPIIRNNIISYNTASDMGGGLCGAGCTLLWNVIHHNSATNRGGGLCQLAYPVMKCSSNTIVSNYSPQGSAIWSYSEPVSLENNIIAYQTGGVAVWKYAECLYGSCNDYWSNAGGDVGRYVSPQCGDPTGINGNIKANPLFCDNVNYYIDVNSPCLNAPGCGLIGARPAGCDNIPPGITVISPNGGETWYVGSTHNITWSSDGTIPNVKIEYSTNSGGTWSTIINSTPNGGVYSWMIPQNPSTQCRVRVSDASDSDPADTSDGDFTICSEPGITVISPNGGETWNVGSTHDITWSYQGTIPNVKIEYSTNSGFTWHTITSGTPNNGVYSWQIPHDPSVQCRVKVSDASDGDPSDMSDGDFTISLQCGDLGFRPNPDGWKFSNTPPNMWPESWWQQFNYCQYPPYPLRWCYQYHCQSSDFPDWPLFASAFGEEQCYYLPGPIPIYRPSAVSFWLALKRDYWMGSCFGFATSSLLFFDDYLHIDSVFPGYTQLCSVQISDTSRIIPNKYQLYQFGELQQQYVNANRNSTTPNQTLQACQDMLNSSERNDRVLSFFPSDGGSGHAVTPYRCQIDEVSPEIYHIYVYDCNLPNSPSRRISINTSTNTWTDNMFGWDGTKYLFLMDRISNYTRHPIIPTSYSEFATVYISLTDTARFETLSGSIGHIGDSLFTNISDGHPIIPMTGEETRPIGYYLPNSSWTCRFSGIRDSTFRLSVFVDSTVMVYWRSGIDSTQNENLCYRANDSSLLVLNPDSENRSHNLDIISVDADSEIYYSVNDVSIADGDSARYSLKSASEFQLENYGGEKTYDLRVEIAGINGDTVFFHEGIPLDSNTSHRIVPDWRSHGDSLMILIDSGMVGSFSDTVFVENKGEYIRGDANGDWVINVTDVVYLINHLFISGPAPDPIQAGDVNCDGTINVSDVVYLINYLFISGPPPGC